MDDTEIRISGIEALNKALGPAYWWRQKCLVSMEMDSWKEHSC
jgi:hypothetical protein